VILLPQTGKKKLIEKILKESSIEKSNRKAITSMIMNRFKSIHGFDSELYENHVCTYFAQLDKEMKKTTRKKK
jgi:hypothetical protein